MKQRRLPNGRYRINYFDRVFPVIMMVFLASVCFGLQRGNEFEIQRVQAREGANNAKLGGYSQTTTPSPTPTPQLAVIEPTIMPTATPTPTLTQKEAIVSEIERVFGDDAPMAKKIVECESMWNPDAVGDKNLLAYHSGEVVGDSIGLFQIRTGGWDFNRAKANGMTADEFRQEMFDPIKNIQYAKTIFDRSGWRPWSCSKLVK